MQGASPRRSWGRRLASAFAWLALLLGLAAAAMHWVTPWPSVLVVRQIFDGFTADSVEKLARHVPRNIRVDAGLSYAADDPDALLDIYRPQQLSPIAPTIVWIHGGGFVSGRRQDIADYLKVLAGRGFAVVNVDYTTAPSAHYPTPVRQLNAALGWVDRNAVRYGLNRNAIVLAGDSAGAQIAAQTANIITAPDYARAVGIAPSLTADQLAGALLYCGVYDIEGMGNSDSAFLRWFVRTVTWSYSGSRDWRSVEGFEYFSVTGHLTPTFPPSFISAGNADPLGPQSVAMARALEGQNVAVTSIFYPANHAARLDHEYQFDLDTPDARAVLDRSVAWLQSLRQGIVPDP